MRRAGSIVVSMDNEWVIAAVAALAGAAGIVAWRAAVALRIDTMAVAAMTMAYRHARRLLVLTVGLTVVALGVVMVVTPGPAILVIPLGLAILATEFFWAKRLLVRFRRKMRDVAAMGKEALGGGKQL